MSHPPETELLDLVAGDLDSRRAGMIGLHLVGCRSCRRKRIRLCEFLDDVAEITDGGLG